MRLLGFYGTRIPFAWPLRWAMVVGAFTNSSLFILQAAFPILDGPPRKVGVQLYSASISWRAS